MKFGISDFGFVTLKIYDILGNEISVLVNEKKKQGSYVIKFDRSNFPSGIYFYELKIETVKGEFSEVKRMILLK